ncbi:MAG TPA: hypothetical protein VKS79_05915 [Gemmataceae bacterium]|nr:hypothetical protein [Gemmataceae bacterium]
MKCLRPFCALVGLLLISTLRAEDPPKEKWLTDRTVTISPAPAPVPTLKYRLYPSTTERKDGNAAPIYERFAHERSDARKKELRDKPAEWNQLPLDKLPMADVKKLLDSYQYNFKQLDLGARRKTVDWNYTLDAGDIIGLLLPDMQEMRLQAALLVLKARFEIAEHRYGDAVRTLETAYSFSEQLAPNPFLVCSLVAIATAGMTADATLDLIEQPDAPNLYWALAPLPRPLVDMRRAMETEMVVLEMEFPDLARLDQPLAPEYWDKVLARLRFHKDRIDDRQGPKEGTKASDLAANSPDLPIARKYLTEVVHLADVDKMQPAKALLLYLSHYYHEIRDDIFKASYLPYPQARPLDVLAEQRLKTGLHDTEAGRLARMLMAAVLKVRLAEVRLERRLAMLRVIEALRMHAASTGQLPDKLSDVKIVPVPDDPGTGKPFEYSRDGDKATLSSRIPGEPLTITGMRYQITLRK